MEEPGRPVDLPQARGAGEPPGGVPPAPPPPRPAAEPAPPPTQYPDPHRSALAVARSIPVTYPAPRLIPPPGPLRTRAFVILGFPLALLAVLLLLAVVNGSSDTTVPNYPGSYGYAPNNGFVPPAAEPTAAEQPATPTLAQQDETFAAPTTSSEDPATVVTEFFDALNRHDYTTEWIKGSAVLSGAGADAFSTALRTTTHVDATVGQSAAGSVPVQLVLTLNDGSQETFGGTCLVSDSAITQIQAARE